MSQQLTDFGAKNRRDIDPFEAAYRAKAEANQSALGEILNDEPQTDPALAPATP